MQETYELHKRMNILKAQEIVQKISKIKQKIELKKEEVIQNNRKHALDIILQEKKDKIQRTRNKKVFLSQVQERKLQMNLENIAFAIKNEQLKLNKLERSKEYKAMQITEEHDRIGLYERKAKSLLRKEKRMLSRLKMTHSVNERSQQDMMNELNHSDNI